MGEETLKVLGADANADTAKSKIIANGGLKNYSLAYNRDQDLRVYGMPIHPTDGDNTPDLSHLELRNSYMSHQDYRNWIIPMEAELAVLKDLGYDIDLSKHFGKSYYLNNATDTFSSGFTSDATQAVGLHLYGNENTITQNSDISTSGEGSFGVRIDGVENTYTLADGKTINATGKENIGLGVTWGQNHEINLAADSTVTATAADGVVVSFDFGENLFGAYSTHKGSYIFYDSNWEFDLKPSQETSEALVKEFNIDNATITGGKAAIYIADNAHVENINITGNTTINGDIISDWNSVSSGPQSKVQRKNAAGIWVAVDPSDPEQIYFTNVNLNGDVFSEIQINGSINGDNGIYNTLKLNNAQSSVLEVTGPTIAVYSLNNDGLIMLDNIVTLTTQTGTITTTADPWTNYGAGLGVDERLNLGANMKQIDIPVELASGTSVLSTINDQKQDVRIFSLLSFGGTPGGLAFDLGDHFRIDTNEYTPSAYETGQYALLDQMKVSKDDLNLLSEDYYQFFDNAGVALDLSGSTVNYYYDGKHYELAQDTADNHRLKITKTTGDAELSNAAEDATTANYIVTDGVLTKDAGTVKGNLFEISGNDINVNGHKGLVIDGTQNQQTTLLTNISGAADSDLTVQNGGSLAVSAQDKELTLGQEDTTTLTLDNATVTLDSTKNAITVAGAIKGANNATDIVTATGSSLTFNQVQNTTLHLNTQEAYINGAASGSIFDLGSGVLQVVQDDYLAAAGNNEVVANGGAINLANGKATDIALGKMTLQSDLQTGIDVDLKNMSADRFVFQDSADLITNANSLRIVNINPVNSKAALKDESYEIPLISSDYHNENFLNAVQADLSASELQSSIFRYKVSWKQDDSQAGLLLQRGSSSNYKSYNPSVLTSPIATQLGGYLGQLAVNDQLFNHLDTMRPQEAQPADKGMSAGEEMYAAFADKDRATLWASPYAAFGKVPLKHGPKVSNKLYGTLAGIDSALYDIGRDWNGIGGLYVAYNGSYQHFDGVSMQQNGGGIGVSGMAYKDNFYAGVLLGGSLSDVRTKTDSGHEHSSMLGANLAAKAGYAWEFGSRGQWLLEPEMLASYTFIDMPSYNNQDGVRIHTEPLQAITLQPQVRIVGRSFSWGQPYAQVAFATNLMDKTKFEAEGIDLPEFSVKPYMKYGLGVRQVWLGQWNCFLQTYVTTGGVRDIGVQAGISHAL